MQSILKLYLKAFTKAKGHQKRLKFRLIGSQS